MMKRFFIMAALVFAALFTGAAVSHAQQIGAVNVTLGQPTYDAASQRYRVSASINAVVPTGATQPGTSSGGARLYMVLTNGSGAVLTTTQGTTAAIPLVVGTNTSSFPIGNGGLSGTLQPGTAYSVQFFSEYQLNGAARSDASTVQPISLPAGTGAPSVPTYTVGNIGPTSFDIQLNPLATFGAASEVNVCATVTWYQNANYGDAFNSCFPASGRILYRPTDTPPIISITGLTPNTEHTFTVWGYYLDSNGTISRVFTAVSNRVRTLGAGQQPTQPGQGAASTFPASQVGPTSARLKGAAFAGAIPTISEPYSRFSRRIMGFEISLNAQDFQNPSSTPQFVGEKQLDRNTVVQNYPLNFDANGLQPNTTYHYRTRVIDYFDITTPTNVNIIAQRDAFLEKKFGTVQSFTTQSQVSVGTSVWYFNEGLQTIDNTDDKRTDRAYATLQACHLGLKGYYTPYGVQEVLATNVPTYSIVVGTQTVPIACYQGVVDENTESIVYETDGLIFSVALGSGALGACGETGAPAPDDCYELLQPLPNGGGLLRTLNVGGSVGDYINLLFQIIIGILTVLAVVMIVVAGIQYMSESSPNGKSGAKSRIQNALLGLALALSIWIILNTINPNLLNLDFTRSLREAGTVIDNSVGGGSGGSGTSNTVQPCPTCVLLTGDSGTVNIPTTSSSAKIALAYKQKLIELKRRTIDSPSNPIAPYVWTITEGYPPTVVHSSSCHYNGTCADLNFRINGNPPANPSTAADIAAFAQTIKTFTDIMRDIGLQALYETANVQLTAELQRIGVNSHPTLTMTGAHFHVK